MSTQLAVIEQAGLAVVHQANRFMPVMPMAMAVQRYNDLVEFTKQIMKEGKDYGCVPGIEKPSLLKPGAEKLCNFFGLTPTFEIVEKEERWDAEEPFFFYFYKCKLWRGQDLIGEGDGSCNSRESKYRFRWVGEAQLPDGFDKKRIQTRGGRMSEFEFAIEKAETSGKYGKPAAYWQAFKDAMANKTAALIQKAIKSGETRPAWEIDCTVYRIPNPDVCDQVNTIQKMAQKRAMVAATLIACNASEYYTQDIEDMDVIDVTPIPSQHTTPNQTKGPEQGHAGKKPGSPTGETGASRETRNDVKSQTGPTAVHSEKPEVLKLWARMTSSDAANEVIGELWGLFLDAVPEKQAQQIYDALWKQHGAPESSKESARAIVAGLYEKIEEFKGVAA